MYYEEKHDHAGNWYYRTTPNEPWRRFTVEMLCKKIEQMQALLASR